MMEPTSTANTRVLRIHASESNPTNSSIAAIKDAAGAKSLIISRPIMTPANNDTKTRLVISAVTMAKRGGMSERNPYSMKVL